MDACRPPSLHGMAPSMQLPPAPAACPHAARSQQAATTSPWWLLWFRKYVVLCLLCGGTAVILGVIFIAIYFTLRSYTSSLQFFETIPTYVPAIVLIVTGFIVMCFAKRRNRYAYLIKLAGGCCLVCALLCVVITVTTTVVHMNRLQTLNNCNYKSHSKSCECTVVDPASKDDDKVVFDNTPNCEVISGSLLTCLRALFGLSVVGILVCIFSSMLVYQLLSHEKKKMYWEQLELRRRFLYRRHPHHAFCGCYEDIYPWQLWEMLDYRFFASRQLTPSPLGEEDGLGSSSPVTHPPTSSGLGGGNHRRSSGWNWLPWPWSSDRNRNRNRNNQVRSQHGAGTRATATRVRRNIMNRLILREGWRHTTGASTPSPITATAAHDSPVQTESPNMSIWRNDCIHIFRSNLRNSLRSAANTAGGLSSRFGGNGNRSRNNAYGRTGAGHRRTRSNDGVFHHLHMNPSMRYNQPYPPPPIPPFPDGTYNFAEIPRYMWGPPPPYSQPPSMENVSILENENRRQDYTRRSSETTRELSLTQAPDSRILESDLSGTTPSHSSKISTPISERRIVCHNFGSEGITLTISGNFSDICPQSDAPKPDINRRKEETCIVEVHVPYILQKNDVIFNTLPARSTKRKDTNPFKSLSNIPLCISRRLSLLKQETFQNGNLSVIQTCCEIKDALNCSLEDVARFGSMKSAICDPLPLKQQRSFEENSNNTSGLTETSPTSLGYQPTIIELPSDYKSSIVIATSPSTPVTENVTLTNMVYAHSMPNLSLSTSPSMCSAKQMSYSGSTSTSQDFADFELEKDSSSAEYASPSSNATSAPSIPEDDEASIRSSCSSICSGQAKWDVVGNNEINIEIPPPLLPAKPPPLPVQQPPSLPPPVLVQPVSRIQNSSSSESPRNIFVHRKSRVEVVPKVHLHSSLPLRRDSMPFVMESCASCPSQPNSEVRPGFARMPNFPKPRESSRVTYLSPKDSNSPNAPPDSFVVTIKSINV